MNATSREWETVCKAMPGHLLEGDPEEEGVVRSVRRDSEERWTWFEGEPGPVEDSSPDIREVVSGVALAMHLQARSDLEHGLTAVDLEATGLPSFDSAYADFESAVLQLLPGVHLGSLPFETMVSSWEEHRSLDPGSWSMYRAVPGTVLDPENETDPASVNDPGGFVEEAYDSTGDAEGTHFALEALGFNVDDVIDTIAVDDPDAASELRRARDGEDEEEADEEPSEDEAEEDDEAEDEGDEAEVTGDGAQEEPRIEPVQAPREEEPYEVDDDAGLHLLGASRMLEALKARKREQDRLREATPSSEPKTKESEPKA